MHMHMHTHTFANMMLHVQRFLQNVWKLWVHLFHNVLQDSELQTLRDQLSQRWLVSAQPIRIQAIATRLAELFDERRRHWALVNDASKKLVPVTTAYRTSFHRINICEVGIVLARGA